jgi:hypothetical protein
VAADTWGLSWKGTTGAWLASWASTFVPPVVVTPTQTPAGRPHKRRLFVEVDGQIFIVENEAHGRAILERAAELAEKAARQQAEEVVDKRLAKSRVRIVQPVQIARPVIATSLDIDLEPFRRRIAKAYEEAANLAEMRLMLERQLALEDEEEAILLLM